MNRNSNKYIARPNAETLPFEHFVSICKDARELYGTTVYVLDLDKARRVLGHYMAEQNEDVLQQRVDDLNY